MHTLACLCMPRRLDPRLREDDDKASLSRGAKPGIGAKYFCTPSAYAIVKGHDRQNATKIAEEGYEPV